MPKHVSDAYVRESINAQLDELGNDKGIVVCPMGCGKQRFDRLYAQVLDERKKASA
jgi:hypothetical protein